MGFLAESFMKTLKVPRGNSKSYTTAIKAGGAPKDCTGLSCVFIVKGRDAYEAPVIITKAISWTAQNLGTGSFSLIPSDTNIYSRTYFYEVVLYGGDYRKSISKGRLKITPSLGIN